MVLVGVAVVVWLPPEASRKFNHRLRARARTAPTVVYVLVEAARPDRFGVCAGPRPNTPVLESLVAAGAAVRCDAIAPSTWSTPGIATALTGLGVPEHGVDTVRRWAPDGSELRPGVRPLAASVQTVAERLLDAGYQTALVSENPLLKPASGLDAGFVSSRVASRFGGARSTHLRQSVQTLLGAELDPSRPLFLTLVLSATREPLTPVPDGVSWAPPRRGLGCFGRLQPRCAAFHAGRMDEAARGAFVEELTDLYDYGVAADDRHLGAALDELDAWGWRSAPWRLVVVGTSGVKLGEGGTYGLGGPVDERLVRVPLLVAGSEPPAPLPVAPSALLAPALAETGAAPTALAAPMSFGNRPGPARPGHHEPTAQARSAAQWEGTVRTTWNDGAWEQVDLATGGPRQVVGPEAAPALAEAVERWLGIIGRPP